MRSNNRLVFHVLKVGPPLTGPQKLVLLSLLDHWNPRNFGAVVWPGQDRLCELARLSLRGVRKALAELEALGVIKITREPGRSNRYQLHPDVIEALTPAPGAGVGVDNPVDNRGDPGTTCRSPRHDVPVTPAPRAAERLNERLSNSLRRSEPHGQTSGRQGEMRLLGDVLRTSNALREKDEDGETDTGPDTASAAD